MAKPGRLGVGIIGAGKVGAVLGAALRAAEHAVVGVSAVSDASRERAETLLPGVPVLEVQDIVERAELVLLAVPDDALGPLVEGLAKLGAWQPGQLVAHTSGRFGVGILRPVRAAGAIPLALHPAMTFTGMSLDLTRLLDCSFGVTADPAMLPIAQALVVEMGAEPVAIAEGDRTLYHAALAARLKPPGHPRGAGLRSCCAKWASKPRNACWAPCCAPAWKTPSPRESRR